MNQNKDEIEKKIKEFGLYQWMLGSLTGIGGMIVFITFLNPLAAAGATMVLVGILSVIMRNLF